MQCGFCQRNIEIATGEVNRYATCDVFLIRYSPARTTIGIEGKESDFVGGIAWDFAGEVERTIRSHDWRRCHFVKR